DRPNLLGAAAGRLAGARPQDAPDSGGAARRLDAGVDLGRGTARGLRLAFGPRLLPRPALGRRPGDRLTVRRVAAVDAGGPGAAVGVAGRPDATAGVVARLHDPA